MGRRRLVVGALLLAFLTAALAVPGPQLANAPVERLSNGDFEEGFYPTAFGPVANGWLPFVSGGGALFSFYQDTWAPVVYNGANSLLITISTMGQTGEGAPHFSGVCQTVAVAPGATYDLTLHGIIRALEDDPDRANYGYRLQYGVDTAGGTSWQSVGEWVEIPWDTVYPRLAPGELQSHSASVVATGDRLTLFVRMLYKWGTVNREVSVNLDAVSLKGAMPVKTGGSGKSYTVVAGSGASAVVLPAGNGATQAVVDLVAPEFPIAGRADKVTIACQSDAGITRLELYDEGALIGRTSHAVGPLQLTSDFVWNPRQPGRHVLKAVAYDTLGGKAYREVVVVVGRLGQFLSNGSFEEGFWASDSGMVGAGWHPFHNGGRPQYGFYDETWIPAVYDGLHSQLVEINTMGPGGADPDRIAGIYQTVDDLTPGAAYQLKFRGMLRARAEDPDREGYNYRIQWGFTADGGSDWTLVTNWAEVPWDTVYPRLDPGKMSEYTVTFEAPARRVTLFVRAWKKWATSHRELDVNLDGFSLEGYQE